MATVDDEPMGGRRSPTVERKIDTGAGTGSWPDSGPSNLQYWQEVTALTQEDVTAMNEEKIIELMLEHHPKYLDGEDVPTLLVQIIAEHPD